MKLYPLLSDVDLGLFLEKCHVFRSSFLILRGFVSGVSTASKSFLCTHAVIFAVYLHPASGGSTVTPKRVVGDLTLPGNGLILSLDIDDILGLRTN